MARGLPASLAAAPAERQLKALRVFNPTKYQAIMVLLRQALEEEWLAQFGRRQRDVDEPPIAQAR